MKPLAGTQERRLYSLDALRGVAALCVVVWHWPHFFALTAGWPQNWNPPTEPFYAVLKPLYDAGWAAVDIFFVLSGFVFFWLYSRAIAERRLAVVQFAWWRLARLYPLYAGTLAVVIVLQLLFWHQTGRLFVFAINPEDFARTLLMAQGWFPPSDLQLFNGPAWSVSVEVLLYALFFLLCRLGFGGARSAAVVAIAGIILLLVGPVEHIPRGLIGFFLGGATWHVTERLKLRSDARTIARILGWVVAGAWGLVLLEDYTGLLHGTAYAISGLLPAGQAAYLAASRNLFLTLFVTLVAAPTVAVLALQEQLLGRRYAGVAFLGDISYSTYLLHFPLQLAAVLLALHFGLSTGFFMNGAVMIAFFVVLIALATASHYWFERPLQNILRRAFRSRRGHSAASASALAESHLSSAAASERMRSARSLARKAASIGR